LLADIERSLLPGTPRPIANAALGRIEVDQSPVDRPVQNLAQRLSRLEAMSFGDAQPPRIDIHGRQIRDALAAEHRGRLAEQPAQLRDRHRRCLVHLQVLVDELAEGHCRPSPAWGDPIKSFAKCLLRLFPAREATDLWPCRAASFESVPVCPQRLAVGVFRLQLEHMALLDHVDLLDR
jgi:hypothetical protein